MPVQPNPSRYEVHLHIQELVLHGFAPADRYAVAAAVEKELGRLFAEESSLPNLGDSREVYQLRGGSFDVQPGARPDAIGMQVAGELYRSLNSLQRNQVPGAKTR